MSAGLRALVQVVVGPPPSPGAGVPGRPGRSLPHRLRWYIVSVSCTWLLLALALSVTYPPEITAQSVGTTFSLAALIAIARVFPVQLAPKKKLIVDTAPALVAALLLAPPLAALSGALGMMAGEVRVRGRWFQAVFNGSVEGLRVGLAAFLFRAALGADFTTADAMEFSPLPLMIAVAVLYIINSLLVDIAAGLTLGQNPFRGWWATQQRKLPHESVLAALGLFAALPARESPWIIPLLVVPAAIVRRSLQDSAPIKSETREALESLAEAVDLRHQRAANHSRRVAELARAIARRLDLSTRDITLVVDAAMFRDVGEVALPPDLLASAGPLTHDQRTELQRHPGIGADMVKRFPDFADCAALILHHHERWDGLGTPSGLAGETIPLGARIIAVAETYEALIAPRPYREALSPDQARAELRRNAGSQLDPGVVQVLLEILGHEPAGGFTAPTRAVTHGVPGSSR